MYEGVDLDIYLLLLRGMDLIVPCLNYVSVHIKSVEHLPCCTLSFYGTKYPVCWALMMNVIENTSISNLEPLHQPQHHQHTRTRALELQRLPNRWISIAPYFLAAHDSPDQQHRHVVYSSTSTRPTSSCCIQQYFHEISLTIAK